MGDRCNIVITMRWDDLARFAHHVYDTPEEEWWNEMDEEHGIITVSIYDVNYALCDARAAAAKAGIPFYGSHSEGDEYGPCAFVSWQGKQLEVPLNHDGDLVIAVDENLEPIHDLKHLREYVAHLKQVKAAFGATASEPASTT